MGKFTPHSQKQEDAIFSNEPVTLLATGTQFGKGLPLFEEVLTPFGYEQVRTIQIGDILFDRNGDLTQVIGLFPQGIRPCFELLFEDDSSLIVDDAHLNIIYDEGESYDDELLEGYPTERIIATKTLFEEFRYGYSVFRLDKSRLRIKRIKRNGDHKTVCFKVDSQTESFIVRGGIVTHNTTAGPYWMMKYTNLYPKANFIVTAPNYKILSQATLPGFKKVFEQFGHYQSTRAEFHLHYGGIVYFRTSTHPDSVVGIPDVRAVWGDEAGKYPLYFWENLLARAAPKDAPILLTTSPYSMNWLYKELIRPVQEGKRKDVKLIAAKSIENPYYSKAYYEKMKLTMDPRRFSALFDGQFEKMQGLVYDCFEERNNVCDPLIFPTGTRFFGAIDWGYNDPFVLLVVALLPNGYFFQISEVYKTHLIFADIKEIVLGKIKMFNIERVWCDPNRPEYIEELNLKGAKVCVPANNAILLGIDLTYEMIKTRRYSIIRGTSPNTLNELETYHWPEPVNLTPDQPAQVERPVDADNHTLDCVRYLIMGLKHIGLINTPQVNNIIRPPRDIFGEKKNGTEQWS